MELETLWIKQILEALAKFRKATVKLRHVRPSVHIEQLGSHWTDFHEI